MKKSLIALAALTAFAGAASAQSSVQIGGFLDLGVGKSIGTKDKGIQDGGGVGGSRLNFTIVEDLGGGMKALAAMEHRLQPDVGMAGSSSQFWNAYSYVGLSGGFGRVMLGRFYTAAFTQVQNQVDPFAGDTVAALRSVAMHGGIGLGDVRFSNGIRYDFTSGGLTAAFNISESGKAQDGTASATNVDKPWTAAVSYAAGPLYVALSHENPGGDDDKLTQIGARYGIGALTLRGGYSKGTLNTGGDSKGWLVGATYGMGSSLFKVGYATANRNGGSAESKKLGLGYQYNLSKRTFLYADFARDSVPTTNKTGYDFGIRHAF